MKPNSNLDASTDVYIAPAPLGPVDSSRLVAGVSGAGAIVWAAFYIVVGGSLSYVGSAELLLVLMVTIHHIGQAVTSVVSFKLGAVFAAMALAGQFVFSMVYLIRNLESVLGLAFLTTPVICSVCALVIVRRHYAALSQESIG